MKRDFEDFARLAEGPELSREREEIAEAALAEYQDEDGVIDVSDVVNVAYVASTRSTLELLRQYHDWVNAG